MKIDWYPDAYFYSIWSYKNPQYLTCVKSHTVCVVTVSLCHVLCINKIQTEVILYIVEEYFVYLSQSCKESLLIINLVNVAALVVNLVGK